MKSESCSTFLTETKHSLLDILRRPGPEDILHILNFQHFGSTTTLGAKTQRLWNWWLVDRKWRWTEERNLSSKYQSIPTGQLFVGNRRRVSRSSAHYLLYVCTTYIIKYRLYYPLCIYHILDSSPTVVCGKLKVSVDDVSHGTEVRSHLQCPTPSFAFELSNFAWRIWNCNIITSS